MKEIDRLKCLAEIYVLNVIEAGLGLGHIRVQVKGITYKLSVEIESKRKCKIINTKFSDIPIGTIGTILEEKDDGYAIEITGLFKNPNRLLQDPTQETRTYYFEKAEVEILPNDAQPVCSGSDRA